MEAPGNNQVEETPRPPLFAEEGKGDTFNISLILNGKGLILLHKKLRTEDGHPMLYIVEGVYRDTEDGSYRVAYKALYPDEKGIYLGHVRPLSMFTTDRFVILTHVETIDKVRNNEL